MKKTSNIEVKRINRNRVFRFINGLERVSRPEIAAALGLSGPTVLQIVNELLAEGVLEEVGELQSTGGRKAKAVASVRSAKFALGLDITRNHVSLVLSDLSGQALKHVRIHQPFAPTKEYYVQIGEILEWFVQEAKVTKERILGVGISVPGIVDREANMMSYSHMLGASNISCSELAKNIPYPSMLVNDANAAGVTERGDDSRKRTIVYLSLSNSVGGAIIEKGTPGLTGEGADSRFDDYIYTGDHWRGAEFGHMTLVPGGRKCYCGKEGCIDPYCSALQLARHTDGRLEDFFEELAKGNQKFEAIWDEYLDYLAVAVDNLRMVFDCEIVLGGYVGSFMAEYIHIFQKKVAAKDLYGGNGEEVKVCRYQVEASALGAALHYIERYIDSI